MPLPMTYRFDRFELDLSRAELRRDGQCLPLEPQVYGLLRLLVENRDRLVGHGEILARVWDGRAVSPSALASRVKSLRRLLGDDGRNQRLIRTVHGRGLRFLAPVSVDIGPGSAPGSLEPASGGAVPGAGGCPSLAVLPFRLLGGTDTTAATFAEALPHELIGDLARLRWLQVIARGSSFRLRSPDWSPQEIGRLLGVRYSLTGSLEIAGRRLAVAVELADCRDGRVVWADDYSGALDDIHAMREGIRGAVVTALDLRIPLHEASLARLRSTEDLDAWAAFHLGLQHMYRFNPLDNQTAMGWFDQAVALDSGFARAHAGLSFLHFQNAFMGQTRDVADEARKARASALRGLDLDPLDPFVNFTLGRTYWLQGDLDGSLPWLVRATTLSPNYAQGIYARAWTETLAGRNTEGRVHADLAMRLSPLDPLHYAMQGTRALTHLAQGEDEEAARWAEAGARSPGAHIFLFLIAASAHALAGHAAEAAGWAAEVRIRDPRMSPEGFFRSFPIQSPRLRARMFEAMAQLGF